MTNSITNNDRRAVNKEVQKAIKDCIRTLNHCATGTEDCHWFAIS